MAKKKSAAQLNREIAEALSNEPADQWTVHGRLARMSPAEKKRERKDLELARGRLLQGLGYAGNTPERVKWYHDKIAEIDEKLRLFR